MQILKKMFAGVVAAGIGLTATAAFAGDIRVGITMRMVSENGQAYGQMGRCTAHESGGVR